MASAKVLKMDGSEAGAVDLNPAVFGVPPNDPLVHDVLVALRNARRQGNAETKTRKEVRGSGSKPYRQKGTGSARHGSVREPQMRGGGTVFGPHRRSYRQNVPTASRRRALCCALSDRVRTGALSILSDLACDTPRTKPFAEMLARIVPSRRKTLLVTADVDKNVLLSARNIPRVAVCTATDLSALDVVDAAQVVVVQDALPRLENRLTKVHSGKERTQ